MWGLGHEISKILERGVLEPSPSHKFTSRRIPVTSLHKLMLFRITGPQSIERLEPLVPRVVEGAVPLDPRSVGPLKGVESSANEKLDFVWETTCEMTMRDRHSQATVLNKLHNVVILEDKANLAFLQMRMNCPVLETFVASSPHDVHTWASKRWVDGADTPSGSVDGDWWVVKASAGNGP